MATTPVLPGKFHGQRSLMDYSPWGHKGSDTTERAHTQVSIDDECGRVRGKYRLMDWGNGRGNGPKSRAREQIALSSIL